MKLINKIVLLLLLSSVSLNAQDESFEDYVTPLCECGNEIFEENIELLERLYNAWVIDTTLRRNKPLRSSALDSILHAGLSDSELEQIQTQEEALAKFTEDEGFAACMMEKMKVDQYRRIDEILAEMDSFDEVQDYLEDLDCEATALVFKISYLRVHFEKNHPPRENR